MRVNDEKIISTRHHYLHDDVDDGDVGSRARHQASFVGTSNGFGFLGREDFFFFNNNMFTQEV